MGGGWVTAVRSLLCGRCCAKSLVSLYPKGFLGWGACSPPTKNPAKPRERQHTPRPGHPAAESGGRRGAVAAIPSALQTPLQAQRGDQPRLPRQPLREMWGPGKALGSVSRPHYGGHTADLVPGRADGVRKGRRQAPRAAEPGAQGRTRPYCHRSPRKPGPRPRPCHLPEAPGTA